MKRRHFLLQSTACAALLGLPLYLSLRPTQGQAKSALGVSNGSQQKDNPSDLESWSLSEEEWRKRLTPKQFDILREEGTEYPNSSPLNNEKRKGTYACAGCELPLFTSDMKFDSGTGWPSFFTTIKGSVETSTDFKLIYPRTEYHCARCGGHQGHVFEDGPRPTGQRWCNNGVALKFLPETANS